MDEMNDGQLTTALGPRVPLQETERASDAQADVLAPPDLRASTSIMVR